MNGANDWLNVSTKKHKNIKIEDVINMTQIKNDVEKVDLIGDAADD